MRLVMLIQNLNAEVVPPILRVMVRQKMLNLWTYSYSLLVWIYTWH